MWEMITAQRMLVGKTLWNRSPGDLRICGRINTKIDLKEVQCEAVDWIKLVPDIRAN